MMLFFPLCLPLLSGFAVKRTSSHRKGAGQQWVFHCEGNAYWDEDGRGDLFRFGSGGQRYSTGRRLINQNYKQ